MRLACSTLLIRSVSNDTKMNRQSGRLEGITEVKEVLKEV